MRKLVTDEECRTLFFDIDFGELRVRALYDAKCSVWQSAHHARPRGERDRLLLQMFLTSESGTRCQFNSTTRRGLISHMVKAHGFYDPVQRAVITNECPWCRSIFSTRLDAQHHACSSFLHGFCRAGGSHVQTEIKQPLLPVVCPLCEIEGVAIKNLSHRLFHMLNLFRCSFHLCPTIMTTSSGAICLYLVSRERGLQKLHSFVAPTMLPRRDLLRLAMCAE